MSISSLKQKTIGEIVANDFRAASIFKNNGIDFCCGGNISLTEACSSKNLDVEHFILELNVLAQTEERNPLRFNDWDLPFLCDYIMQTHHKFVLKHLPELVFYTQKISDVHGGNHTELVEVARLFTQINTELLQHLKNEEEVLFPAIKKSVISPSTEAKSVIHSEIKRMQNEHDFAGGAMDKINLLTNHYHVPDDACNTYRVALKMLDQFEDDLHIHVHLENNILYPKALKIN